MNAVEQPGGRDRGDAHLFDWRQLGLEVTGECPHRILGPLSAYRPLEIDEDDRV